MKALGVATMLVLALFLGIFVWALASGTPLSGEPSALMHINKETNPQKMAHSQSVSTPAVQGLSGGQAQVVLNVTPDHLRSTPTPLTKGSSNGLIEQSKFGPLPKRSTDGRSPSLVYARADLTVADALPRIAILVTGLGLNQRLSERAVQKFPPEISLAFSSYGRRLPKLVSKARDLGHELMLQVPMEPHDYPESDTGPQTLLVANSALENRPRLYWSLGRFSGYFGVVNNKGGRFLANNKAADGLFKELQHRGLVFFRENTGGSPALLQIAERVGLGYSQANLQIDRNPSGGAIARALQKLEASAKRSGFAVGVAHMHPVSINLISEWARKLESRGFHLVPVSAAYGRSRS
ncbi:MAG: divergent polysaccharide deacetylase family protein [bacterium]|nr:divergent polysaccharide deacetylase family protein [bacterium]